MPNHITNELTIIGNIDDMKRFKDQFLVKENNRVVEATFNNIHPMPPEYNDNGMWYDWRIENWGTKWNAYSLVIDQNVKNKLSCTFLTAWSPPVGFLIKASETYPALVFDMYYMDEGDNFCGMLHAESGWVNDECVDVEYEVDGEPVYYEDEGGLFVWKFSKNGKKIHEDDTVERVNPLKLK